MTRPGTLRKPTRKAQGELWAWRLQMHCRVKPEAMTCFQAPLSAQDHPTGSKSRSERKCSQTLLNDPTHPIYHRNQEASTPR